MSAQRTELLECRVLPGLTEYAPTGTVNKRGKSVDKRGRPIKPGHSIIEQIKAKVPIPDLSARFGYQDIPRGSCHSPFREDRNPSFSVYANGRKFKDHADPDCRGDVIDFFERAIGCDRPTAIRELAIIAGPDYNCGGGSAALVPNRPTPKQPDPAPDKGLTEEQVQKIVSSASLLRENPGVIAGRRKWSPETIKALADQQVLGLWGDGGQQPAFIFKNALKTRDLVVGKDKRVWYPISTGRVPLWRSNLLQDNHRRIYLTAGEPDAITLIDSGVEQDGSALVLALPGESFDLKPPDNLDLFRNREVVIVPHLDAPGIKALRRNTHLLIDIASKVYWLGAVPHVLTPDAANAVKDLTDLRDLLGRKLTTDELGRRTIRVDDLGQRIKDWCVRRFGPDVLVVEAEVTSEGLGVVAEDEPFKIAERLGLYYHISQKEFLVKNRQNQWLPHTSGGIKERIELQGYSSREQARRIALATQEDRAVDFVGSWCGKQEGYYRDIGSGRAALVTEGIKLIEPAEGEWRTLETVITNAIGDENEQHRIEQLTVFHGWIKSAYIALKAQIWKAARMLALAGEVQSCKSLLQWIITQVLGGRAAKPALYLQGKTNFNSDLFGAEHLMLEDEHAETSHAARLAFPSAIKQITVNQLQPHHGKHRDILHLEASWRLSVSLNNEPERLMILPELDARRGRQSNTAEEHSARTTGGHQHA